MRDWEKALSVLEALREREEEAVHGWVLDREFLLPRQQSVSVLESPGLVDLAWWIWPGGRTARDCRPGRADRCGGRPGADPARRAADDGTARVCCPGRAAGKVTVSACPARASGVRRGPGLV
jgi:hypothetical protein